MTHGNFPWITSFSKWPIREVRYLSLKYYRCTVLCLWEQYHIVQTSIYYKHHQQNLTGCHAPVKGISASPSIQIGEDSVQSLVAHLIYNINRGRIGTRDTKLLLLAAQITGDQATRWEGISRFDSLEISLAWGTESNRAFLHIKEYRLHFSSTIQIVICLGFDNFIKWPLMVGLSVGFRKCSSYIKQ